MILIHGGPGGNHTLYSDIQLNLFELADFVIIDLRGCELIKSGYIRYCILEHNINDFDSVIEKLNIPNPIIHGCAYSSIVALAMLFNILTGLKNSFYHPVLQVVIL